jgi:small subunit ribosomal protein S6
LETITNQLYEGMFLVDVARASSDWDGVIATIKKILERSGAEIISIKKWDDRKLAYDIKGQSRGVYILCYFRVDGKKMREIENSIRLSEQIMRVLILNADQMTQEDIEKETPAAKAEKEGIKTSEETSEVEIEVQQSEGLESEEEQEDEQAWEEENVQNYDDETEDIGDPASDSNLND